MKQEESGQTLLPMDVEPELPAEKFAHNVYYGSTAPTTASAGDIWFAQNTVQPSYSDWSDSSGYYSNTFVYDNCRFSVNAGWFSHLLTKVEAKYAGIKVPILSIGMVGGAFYVEADITLLGRRDRVVLNIPGYALNNTWVSYPHFVPGYEPLVVSLYFEDGLTF